VGREGNQFSIDSGECVIESVEISSQFPQPIYLIEIQTDFILQHPNGIGYGIAECISLKKVIEELLRSWWKQLRDQTAIRGIEDARIPRLILLPNHLAYLHITI
jgi:hypothetical protein